MSTLNSGQSAARIYGRRNRGFLSLVQVFLGVLFHAGASYGVPFASDSGILNGLSKEAVASGAADPKLWVYLGIAIALVVLGGAFAGLTIALMGQDAVYLQVISTSGEGSEKKAATKVLNLLQRGKHWVLVTLLVGNVITNETLPIVLDRALGGGYTAAISSTVLVIIFGEIVPQSICVRFGLPVGALCAPMVLVLMWIFAPITWPIAKLLDYLLGEEHGTIYKKAGLKTLVTLHKTVGQSPAERLNEDEVQIISGVLDLKGKPVGEIMTPMSDVFTLSADAVLDEEMIEVIMREGYSRIPIHEPSNKGDFVGMLLVKMLITYDPEDAKPVNAFELATLPETRPDTSCLDIINFFQEGKSHMVLVSASPAEPYGALGVVTLEDVIEELIGEEIIDESDVFIDVHKATRRLHPAPRHLHRIRLHANDENKEDGGVDPTPESGTKFSNATAKRGSVGSLDRPGSPLVAAHRLQRASSNGSAQIKLSGKTYPPEMVQQLRNLGPSNVASRPKTTRISTVKVKPGGVKIPESIAENQPMMKSPTPAPPEGRRIISPEPARAQGGIGAGLVSPGLDARDGVQTVRAAYGTWGRSLSSNSVVSGRNQNGQHRQKPSRNNSGLSDQAPEEPEEEPRNRTEKMIVERSNSQSTLGSLHSVDSRSQKRRPTARSGSITEQIVEIGGRKKLVLDLESDSSDEGEASNSKAVKESRSSRENRSRSHQSRGKGNGENANEGDGGEGHEEGASKPKKKRRHRGSRNKKKDGQKDGHGKGDDDENTPLLKPPHP